MSSVRFRARNIFGRKIYYPCCKASELILKLLSQKSLTSVQLSTVKEMGREIGFGIELEENEDE